MRHRNLIRTPIDTINILGAGGINQSSISEIYGVEKSGKTSFSYQTAGIFLEDNPDGVVHFIDTENSLDYLRLKEVFKVDLDRIEVHNCRTLESAFKVILNAIERLDNQMMGKIKEGKSETTILSKDKVLKLEDSEFVKYCEDFKYKNELGAEIVISKLFDEKDSVSSRILMMKKLALCNGYRIGKEENYMSPVLFIWDTIAATKPEKEVFAAMKGEDAVNAGGLGLKARVIEQYCCTLLSNMVGKPITCFILNQVRLTGFGSWTGPHETSSGGNALKHNCHYRFLFKRVDNKESRERGYDSSIEMKTGTTSKVTIEKAKFCPVTQDLEIQINDQLGGVIVPSEELALLAIKLGILIENRGWLNFPEYEDMGKFRWEKKTDPEKYIANNPKIRRFLINEIARHYRKSYLTLDFLYKSLGKDEIGKLKEQDKPSQATLNDMETLNDLKNNPFA